MAGELIEEFGELMTSITLAKGESGRFDVEVNGQMVFSKEQEHRHANPGEVVDTIKRISITNAGNGQTEAWT